MRAAASEAGRDPAALRVVLRIVEAAGRSDELAPRLPELAAAGVDEIIVDVSLENGEAADVFARLARRRARERELDGRVVLLTGASGGIGSVTAAALGARGAALVAHYGANREGAEAAVAALPEERRLLVQADLAAPGLPAASSPRRSRWRGRVDVVVVNAATLLETPFDGGDELWDENWEATLRVNVLEPVSLMREARAPLPRRRAAARSSRSRAGRPSGARRSRGSPPTRRRRRPCGTSRRRSRAITRRTGSSPTSSRRASSRRRCPRSRPSRAAASTRSTPRSRWARWCPPEEVAELIAFLATGRSRHLSGATIDVNGATYIR